MTVLSDFKAPARVKNPDVYHAFHRLNRECLHCGAGNIMACHLLRGIWREDVLEGLIPLCPLCHGAFDNGVVYTGEFGRRVTPAAVRYSVAFFLSSPEGTAQRAYLVDRRGEEQTAFFIACLEGSA